MNWLRWSFLHAALKVFPSETPEGLIYNCDDYTAALAGRALQSAFNLIGIKGDWQEFCITLAFATWNAVLTPCLHCFTNRAEMFNIDRWDVLQEPHQPLTQDVYDQECTMSETKVLVTAGNFAKLRASLR